MNLCIDIGNTRLKYLIFNQDKEVEYYTSDEFDLKLLKLILEKYSIEKSIISSTRIIDEEWLEYLKSNTEFFNFADNILNIPIDIEYETPETLGKDRIASAVAASVLFPDEYCIIINAGTCITYDAVNEKGIYLGGNISPGITMRLQAMHTFTDKLPLVEIKYNPQIFGSSTVKALQNGAVLGAIYEIESFLHTVISIENKVNIIVTGGDANIFAKHLNFKIFAIPNLVLLGLNNILRYNADQ